MANKVQLKKSSVAARVPLTTDLDYGELALNYADGKLYYKKSDGTTIDYFPSVGYVPLLSGSYANPTWIASLDGSKITGNISGNANTATTASAVAWTGVTGKPTTLSGYGITDAYSSSNPAGYITSAALSSYQPILVSGTNIKTVNGTSLLGSGDLTVSASTANSLLNFTAAYSANPINPDSPPTLDAVGYCGSVSLFGQTDGGLYSSAYSTSWYHQIFGDFRTGQIAIRGKNSGTWQAWRTVLDSSNVSSYAVQLNTWVGSSLIHTDGRHYGTIFYDSNNSAYYCDPNSRSNFSSLQFDNSNLYMYQGDGTALRIQTAYGWMNLGAQNSSWTHMYADRPFYTNQDWYVNGNLIHHDGNASRARNSQLMYYQGFTLDANTMDPNSTGFTYSVNAPATGPIARFSTGGGYDLWLNSAYSNGTTLYFRTRQGDAGTLNTWRALVSYGVNYAGALYGNTLYDADDTGYYIDPNSTSATALRMRGGALFGPNSNWGTYLYVGGNGDYDSGQAQVFTTNGNLHLEPKAGYQIYLSHYRGGWFRAYGWYDNDDTGYYVDPNSTSRMATINGNDLSSARFSSNQGNQNPNSSHPGYGIRPFYSWNTGQAYNDTSGYSNGITVGSHPGDQAYGFQLVQNMWDDATYTRRYNSGWQSWRKLQWINDWMGSSLIHEDGRHYATIMYDSNNSGYYCDPNGTSRMVTINADSLYSYGNITVASDENLKTDWEDLPQDYVEQLAKVKSGKYTRIDTKDRQAGVGAQSFKNILPEVVIKNGEYLGVNYGNAALVSAVELAKRVVEQNTRIARLEELISKLIDN